MADVGKDINKARQLLERGELVAVPTETVYGLAANALDDAAVARIFAAKNRPQFDPLIVHVSSVESATPYVDEIPTQAQKLAEKFWPGALTIVLKKTNLIPDLVTAGLDTVGIRCPDHPITLELLNQLPFPLAAPSANPFGYVSPTTPAHVNEQLGDRIAYILDGGECRVGIESTIIGFENDQPITYRIGGISIEDVEAIVGPVTLRTQSGSNPRAPGQLQSHYAPKKPVRTGNLNDLLQEYPAHCSAILTFQKDYNSPYQFILSPSGSLEEAARNLFSALRRLEKLPVDVILAEFVPDIGLGRAINDRLRRAAYRSGREKAN